MINRRGALGAVLGVGVCAGVPVNVAHASMPSQVGALSVHRLLVAISLHQKPGALVMNKRLRWRLNQFSSQIGHGLLWEKEEDGSRRAYFHGLPIYIPDSIGPMGFAETYPGHETPGASIYVTMGPEDAARLAGRQWRDEALMLAALPGAIRVWGVTDEPFVA